MEDEAAYKKYEATIDGKEASETVDFSALEKYLKDVSARDT